MKQITAIFGGTLERERERVRPVSKIVPIFLGLFFAVSVTPAFCDEDNDCVSSPYDGRRYCCNTHFLPDGATNKNHGDYIPWDQFEGTVKKCEGSFFEDDKWSDPIVRIGSTQEEFAEYDLVTENHLMYYSEYNEKLGVWQTPKCAENLTFQCDTFKKDGKTAAFLIYRSNGYDDEDHIYKCQDTLLPDWAQEYIEKIYGEVQKVNHGDIIYVGLNDDDSLYSVIICATKQFEWPDVCNSNKISETQFRDKYFDSEQGIYRIGNNNWRFGDNTACIYFTDFETSESESSNDDVAAESEEETTTESEESSSETGIQYDYQQCESNSDCTREKLSAFLSGNPYLHSTEWYCIEQSAGNKVCASKACENGYHIAKYANGNSKGFCEKDAPVQPNANAGQSGQSGANGSVGSANANSPSNKIVATKQHDTDEKSEEIKKLTEKINKTYTELQGLTKNLSEWKNTEGKFNTARLASDSTAAVVLGTVGGVVTAKLVKKSQVKKGFESLQCYIGGQPIAAYGDEVTIGR